MLEPDIKPGGVGVAAGLVSSQQSALRFFSHRCMSEALQIVEFMGSANLQVAPQRVQRCKATLMKLVEQILVLQPRESIRPDKV
jgi:hypothetical protein